MKKSLLLSITVLCACLIPATASAHPGGRGTVGFLAGLEHPIFGLDHLLAMLAVGLWAIQQGGRATWAVPISFVSIMALGGALGMGGLALPFIEPVILGSVLLLGLLVAAAVKLPVWASAAVVGIFAVFHGHAHGAEMPEAASGAFYAAGFILATAGLHLTGMGLGALLKGPAKLIALRASGGMIAAWGALLIAQSFA